MILAHKLKITEWEKLYHSQIHGRNDDCKYWMKKIKHIQLCTRQFESPYVFRCHNLTETVIQNTGLEII